MKNSKLFITALRTEAIGFAIILLIWSIGTMIYPSYIIPSPISVLADVREYLPKDFSHHVLLTAGRVLSGFALSISIGTLLGIAAYLQKWVPALNSLMSALQVLPGVILGVIFLLMFGIGSTVPILLITFLVLPTIAITTANGLAKKNTALEEYLKTVKSNKTTIWKTIYLPALIPVLLSNFSLGVSMAAKVVVLGEFVGSQDGLGYLLNRAQITFNMKEVFFYLIILLSFTLLVQSLLAFFSSIFFKKYFYAE